LPFTEAELSAHFAPINGKTADEVAATHLPYYRKSATSYAAFAHAHPPPAALPINAMKQARQIEKDERFWVVAALIAYHRASDKSGGIAKLLTRAFGATPPMHGLARFEHCFTDETLLFFEANLPSPERGHASDRGRGSTS
jgi:hypothetical protein